MIKEGTSTSRITRDKHGGVPIYCRSGTRHICVLVHFWVKQLAFLLILKKIRPSRTANCLLAETSTAPNRSNVPKGVSRLATSASVPFIGYAHSRCRRDKLFVRVALGEVDIVRGWFAGWVMNENRGKLSNPPSTSIGIVSSTLLILPPKPKKNEISAPGPKRARNRHKKYDYKIEVTHSILCWWMSVLHWKHLWQSRQIVANPLSPSRIFPSLIWCSMWPQCNWLWIGTSWHNLRGSAKVASLHVGFSTVADNPLLASPPPLACATFESHLGLNCLVLLISTQKIFFTKVKDIFNKTPVVSFVSIDLAKLVLIECEPVRSWWIKKIACKLFLWTAEKFFWSQWKINCLSHFWAHSRPQKADWSVLPWSPGPFQ